MQENRGLKRKASAESSVPGHLRELAHTIARGLGELAHDDPIWGCGSACLAILEKKPEELLDLAHQKLHAWPYKSVPTCWRRAYEEASLWIAVRLLRTEAKNEQLRNANLPLKGGLKDEESAWLTQLVKTLDMAIQLTGAPSRSQTMDMIFAELEECVPASCVADLPSHFSAATPRELETVRPIPRRLSPPSLEEFQSVLDKDNTPLIIERALDHWPARQKWIFPTYWMDRTLGGRRLVPVEVGKQYTDDAWSQQILPFGKFMTTYLLAEPDQTGYLAQYDLFAQIPALRFDVQVPDYCYCSPPHPFMSNGDREGMLDASDPLMNLWLGPSGTKTPLHTDPYSNILTQVMGYKYIRLYSPKETAKLYPLDINEKGVDMSNTSSVDVSIEHGHDLEIRSNQRMAYPSFEKAEFLEAVLGPGECLYIPQGWWHYVEGLTTGASVSFWWN